VKPASFAYIRPETQDEALSALAEHGDDALVLAGGLSLGAMLNMRLAFAETIIDINRIPALNRIERVDESLRTGAMVRQADALKSADVSEAAPLLRLGLQNVGHYQTRSRGTLGGSVAHADPSAEIPLCLATLDGVVELASQRGSRRVPAREFADTALSTIREPDEMVEALHWPIHTGAGVAFQEIAQRHGDFAIVAVAAVIRNETEFSLGFGGVEGVPRVLDGMVGGSVEETVGAFVDELDAMDDPRASAEYRIGVARHLGVQTLRQAQELAT
jgi:2-furoyl-CoA dehydrogenase FAD binding subunit|tara:strand:- start:548 stop:1369 length:822 start_codon:yes stop_codon:yes gene_type:complete